ncbi:AAA family ATPase [Catenulispora rubra]|uniref:AAA family ATPase n=1 Tax=Catenulispora rubra TaxID=280293 RepID=UPI001E4D53FC|nr:AAA family ATPase [Catenulispora rubra]
MYVDDREAEQILATLPGLTGPSPEQVGVVRARLRPVMDKAEAWFETSLADGLAASRGSESAAAFTASDLSGASDAAAAVDDSGSDFARLVAVARLNGVDARVLAVLAAVEMSPHRMRLVTYLQDNVQLPRLTVASMDRMVPGAARRLAPGAPLRRSGLVQTAPDGPWATRMCWPAERVVWALAGDDSPDPGLPSGAVRLDAADPQATDSATGSATDSAADSATGSAAEPELLLVSGSDADSRLAAVRRAWPGRRLLVTRPPATEQEWSAVAREAAVGGRAVLLRLTGTLDPAAADRVATLTELSWAFSSPRELALDTLPARPWSEVRLESEAADAADWQRVLGVPPDPAYPLSREQLRLVAAACGGDPARIGDAVRRLAGGHLDGLAVRVRPRRTMADLVLPADETARLRELTARCRGRGVVYRDWGFLPLPSRGVVALFSGPSGTGKTLAAEVVAGELGLDLYKVDLSSVVSKYIGETEQNLEQIFQAASAGDLVLFFDEADALFGKRSEVGDAHDRYANIEVAYLLQRLETYDGLVVLATNLQRNIDDAFLRRISVSIDFAAPDEEHRRRIWEQAFPDTAPVDVLDFGYLARQFKITGGVIRNAALAAAFLAAETAGGRITMETVVLALKREFQKLGRLRTEVDFGPYFSLVDGDHDVPSS